MAKTTCLCRSIDLGQVGHITFQKSKIFTYNWKLLLRSSWEMQCPHKLLLMSTAVAIIHVTGIKMDHSDNIYQGIP